MQTGTGLIHIYHGDGKGKTTACVGLAVRCAGGGGKVLFYQFLKDGSSGEIGVLKSIPGIVVMDGKATVKFSFLMTEEEKQEAKVFYTEHFRELTRKAREGGYQMLVMDEILHAVNLGYLPLEDVTEFLKTKPEDLEVVMSGRDPKEELVELADYVTEMKKVKHPFDRGIPARDLIEK